MLILKEGWRVKHLVYLGNNEYHLELKKKERRRKEEGTKETIS